MTEKSSPNLPTAPLSGPAVPSAADTPLLPLADEPVEAQRASPLPAPFPAPFPASGPVVEPRPRRAPVVGVGASAGGLEALEQFFAHVPANSGLAFVVVQHLDPAKESILPELLQRSASIPVVQLSDRVATEPNHVYVAPPGFEVTLLNGVLHLLKPVAPRGLRLPIDFFLRSLAVDQQANAAGVILSGMGSDGTLGLRALKEKAGGIFVQSPETARFPAMPSSAIDAGLADVVAAPDELPARIVAYFDHPIQALAETRQAEHLNSSLEKVLILVRAQTGHDFSLYKKSTVYRRIQRRMAIHQLPTVDAYVQYVRQNALEADLLFKELLIGVTCFFRDPEVWHHLKGEVLPKLIQTRPEGGVLRAWVSACSTGEEAYSLAMLFAEVVDELEPESHFSLQIFATDLDADAITKARTGFYPENIAGDVSPDRLRRFFTKVQGGYRVVKAIRSMVIFAQQSIASDPPFAKLDILTCRNLMIYLEPDLQRSLLQMFHGSLVPGGVLVLGSAETIGQAADLFTPLDVKSRIFRRLGGSVQRAISFPVHSNSGVLGGKPGQSLVRIENEAGLPANTRPSMQTLADQVLLHRFCPAAVLVTTKGDIVYFSGKTGKYLEPPAGKANLNLFAMARRGLSQPLSEIFYQAVRQKAGTELDEVLIASDGGRTAQQRFKVTVEPLEEPTELAGLLLVVFSDLPAAHSPLAPEGNEEVSAVDARITELTQALARSREENQSTREEMQTSQEELKSANEELQSANEELTTSREEMQSMNEELQTVNSELQGRVDALARASDDMENLLNSTDIATLFLDERLHVRRFTTRTTSLIKLIPTDVGRPITDIVSDLDYPHLARDAEDVLRTLMFKEIEVTAGASRWYKVRIMPYRTQDNRIDGAVITFTDISAAKRLEASLRIGAIGDRDSV
jgi:two-component system, chemotaxis family, CheB/CheR fusion protein